MKSSAKHESLILSDIHQSARRMVAGLEVAKREQKNLSQHLKMLDKYGERGAASKSAAQISRNSPNPAFGHGALCGGGHCSCGRSRRS